MIEDVRCEPSKHFKKSFCTLLTVYDYLEDFLGWIDRCHPQLSFEDLYARAPFACPDTNWHHAEVSLFNHLAIQFPNFWSLLGDYAREFRKNDDYSTLGRILNRRDRHGRTFLDAWQEQVATGNYFGARFMAHMTGVTKRTACRFGGQYAKYDPPADCVPHRLYVPGAGQ